jgi:hypothetical protein
MTKLVEQAIEKIPELLDADQDDAAELLLIVSSRAAGPEKLDKATRVVGLEGFAAGTPRRVCH